jgi:microcystin-dependent protein
VSDPYIGEIKLCSFNFPPRGWAFCNGQLLPIQQNQALFSVLGTRYGGNGVTNFALPNLQGRMPIHQSARHVVGEAGGETAHVLTQQEMPGHVHLAAGRTEPGSPGTSPAGAVWAAGARAAFTDTPTQVMAPAAVSNVGGNQPHENQPPYLALNFIIALVGVFPSQN